MQLKFQFRKYGGTGYPMIFFKDDSLDSQRIRKYNALTDVVVNPQLTPPLKGVSYGFSVLGFKDTDRVIPNSFARYDETYVEAHPDEVSCASSAELVSAAKSFFGRGAFEAEEGICDFYAFCEAVSQTDSVASTASGNAYTVAYLYRGLVSSLLAKITAPSVGVQRLQGLLSGQSIPSTVYAEPTDLRDVAQCIADDISMESYANGHGSKNGVTPLGSLEEVLCTRFFDSLIPGSNLKGLIAAAEVKVHE